MRRILLVFGAALVLGLVGWAAVVAGERLVAVPAEPSPEVEATMTVFTDDEAGFSLSYPRDWQRVRPDDPAVRLLVTPNHEESLLVRVVPLDAPVTAEDLPDVRPLTDELVTGGQTVQVLADPTQVEIGGLPGIQYVYTFEDERSGREGVHTHYFLFHGDTMFAVVLQAVPPDDFTALAPTFQAILDSFEVRPT